MPLIVHHLLVDDFCLRFDLLTLLSLDRRSERRYTQRLTPYIRCYASSENHNSVSILTSTDSVRAESTKRNLLGRRDDGVERTLLYLTTYDSRFTSLCLP